MANKQKAKNTKIQQSVVGTYATMADAEAAVKLLNNGKFPVGQISILTTNLKNEKDVLGFVTEGEVMKMQTKTGAWFGGLFGVLVGTAFIWVPGVGPLYAAGSLATKLISTLEGPVAEDELSGILSGLAGWGLSKQHIRKYVDELKNGKFLVIAYGIPDEVMKANEILKKAKPEALYLYMKETKDRKEQI